MPDNETSVPFLRWAGGKRWLASDLAPFLQQCLEPSSGTYFEPFLGAGAMFFKVAPQRSVLSDLNPELIDTYISVRDSWQLVESKMKEWDVSRDTYYKIRSYRPEKAVNKAARFIWLNRVCYGGLYRVNKKNNFNVPYGGGSRTPKTLYDNNILNKASKVLQNNITNSDMACLLFSDFEPVMEKSAAGDLIYCDPTYSDVTRDQFDRYGSTIFSWQDQERLARVCADAYDRGVTVIISNGFFRDLIQLYPSAYRVSVSKKKAIGNNSNSPDRHKEYVLILDPEKRRKIWKNFALVAGSELGMP